MMEMGANVLEYRWAVESGDKTEVIKVLKKMPLCRWFLRSDMVPNAGRGLATHAQSMVSTMESGKFVKVVSEFVHVWSVLNGVGHAWHPTWFCGPQDGELEPHVEYLRKLTAVAEKRCAELNAGRVEWQEKAFGVARGNVEATACYFPIAITCSSEARKWSFSVQTHPVLKVTIEGGGPTKEELDDLLPDGCRKLAIELIMAMVAQHRCSPMQYR
jgi:hypothetical protein